MTTTDPAIRAMTTALPEVITELIPRLAAGFELLDGDHMVIIEIDHGWRYMQFAAFEPNLRGESVGGCYTDDHNRLSSQDEAWLAANGWNEPDADGNYWRHWEPAQPLAAATVAAMTLHHVHEVTNAAQLTFVTDQNEVVVAITGGEQ